MSTERWRFACPVPAILALEDGSVFKGVAIGANGASVGEVVFNTAMSGYQEILTDPSYARQIVTLTYPHIGNTGTNAEDEESTGVWADGPGHPGPAAAGQQFPQRAEAVPDYLCERGIVAIADIDTRRLTRILREKGAQNGCLMAGDTADEHERWLRPERFAGLKGMDLASEVTTAAQPTPGLKAAGVRGKGHRERAEADLPWHVVAYDYGVKRNILRMLVDRGCRLTVVTAQTPAEEVLALEARWGVPVQWPRRPGALHLRHCGDKGYPGNRCARIRHLPWPPAARTGQRCVHVENEIRAPRRQSPGAESG